MNNVTLETERLLLRPLTVADANEVFEWVGDERVSKYMVYTPMEGSFDTQRSCDLQIENH